MFERLTTLLVSLIISIVIKDNYLVNTTVFIGNIKFCIMYRPVHKQLHL